MLASRSPFCNDADPKNAAAVAFCDRDTGVPTAKISSVVTGLAAVRRDNTLLRGQATVLELIAKGAPLDDVLAELIRYIEAQERGVRCGLLVLAEDGHHFQRGSGPSLPEHYRSALKGAPITPPYVGPCGKAVHRNCVVAVPDIASDHRWSEQWRDLALSSGFAAVHSMPIRGSDGAVLGSLALYYDQPRDPSPADPELIDIAAHLAAIALERSRSEAGVRHANEQTRDLLDVLHQQSRMLIESQQKLAAELSVAERLQRISTALSSGQDVQALYEEILDAAVELMHSDFASLQRLSPERGQAGELRLLGFRGFDPEAARFWEWVRADSGCICGEAMRTGKRAIASDVETCSFMADTPDRAVCLQTGIHAVQSTPLLSRSGRMLGMISTHWRKPHRPSENELQRFDIVARQAADLIERTDAEAALRDSEARYKALVRVSNQVLYTHNPDWSEMRQLWGSGFLADTQTPDAEWLDRYIHREDQPHVLAAIQEAIRTKSVFELEHRVVRADGTPGWTLSRSVPIFDDKGEIIEWFGAASDITARREAEEALRKSEEQCRGYLECSSDVVYRMSADWSEMRHLTGKGFIADTLQPDRDWLAKYIHPDDQPMVTEAINEAIRGKTPFELEHRVLRVDGTLGWSHSRAIPLCDADGGIFEWFGTASDVTERKRHEHHQKLLVNELNHRVKNTLATVQSIALQTLRNAAGPEQAREQITARLIALSKVHDVLTQTSWERAQLRQIVTEATAVLDSENGSRFDIEGPDVWVSAKSALALAMALHELCTNAVKYGALSNDRGRVAIEWTVAEDDGATRQLRMRWVEAGGPPVTPPDRRGFGSRLIEHGLGQDLGGEVRVEFAPAGVTCTILAPLDASGSFTAPDERQEYA